WPPRRASSPTPRQRCSATPVRVALWPTVRKPSCWSRRASGPTSTPPPRT
ncbi:MAG: hypothetical protein AVDCRST_MAG06-1943, partial [uncultured Nocardioides sp.]